MVIRITGPGHLLMTLAASMLLTSVSNAQSVVLQVLAAGVPGDYNADGTVDAADYVVWRKSDGTQTGYDTWRANFGRSTGNGPAATGSAEGLNLAVPEPSAATFLLAVASATALLRRRKV